MMSSNIHFTNLKIFSAHWFSTIQIKYSFLTVITLIITKDNVNITEELLTIHTHSSKSCPNVDCLWHNGHSELRLFSGYPYPNVFKGYSNIVSGTQIEDIHTHDRYTKIVSPTWMLFLTSCWYLMVWKLLSFPMREPKYNLWDEKK